MVTRARPRRGGRRRGRGCRWRDGRAILERLAAGEATVNELAAPFPISVQAVSKHLHVLERAGLIERSRTAQLRPSRLRAHPLGDAGALARAISLVLDR